MSEILLFGVSGGRLEAKYLRKIEKCSAVVTSPRHQEVLGKREIHKIPISPMEEMIFSLAVALKEGDVAVLASGDPLFFGLGRTLIDRFGPERVQIFPALSAVQLACTRFKMPWEDLRILSLHGRSPLALAGQILSQPRVLLFTDQHNSPHRIAQDLLILLEEHQDYERMDSIQIRVAENLGWPDERLYSGSLAETAEERFAPLNMMLIEQLRDEDEEEGEEEKPCIFGLQEDEISHSRGLITKDEIRAVILHRLRLPKSGVFWDVGGGSGSVSVEAARLCPELAVYTIEHKEERIENIRENIVRYNLYNIHVICASAPEAFVQVPRPDRVFIGGNQGLLAEIIPPCAERLLPGGRIVVSAVLEITAEQAPLLLAANGLETDVRTISVTREQSEYGQPATRLNPITIITGKK
jgi:precorrin-6Y C5,15-methyltransferase (decarboxylating)